MTPESQRIVIAEACGYKPYPWFTGDFLIKQGNLWPPFWVKDRKDAYIPDYLNDLNAMHEAEKVLTPAQTRDYIRYLSIIEAPACRATAAQRAEAFLRTLGLWKD